MTPEGKKRNKVLSVQLKQFLLLFLFFGLRIEFQNSI